MNSTDRLFNGDFMQSGPKKSPKVRTSGKYRGGVRTCAQVCLASPPHPALAPAIANPSYGVPHPRLAIRRLVDCFVDWRQRRQRRRRRRRRGPHVDPSSGD